MKREEMTQEEMSRNFEELDFPTYNEKFWKGIAIAQDRQIKEYMQSNEWKKYVEEWRNMCTKETKS